MKTGNWELSFYGILNICTSMYKWEEKPTVQQILKVVPEMPVLDAETLVKDLWVSPDGYGTRIRFVLEEVYDEVDI